MEIASPQGLSRRSSTISWKKARMAVRQRSISSGSVSPISSTPRTQPTNSSARAGSMPRICAMTRGVICSA